VEGIKIGVRLSSCVEECTFLPKTKNESEYEAARRISADFKRKPLSPSELLSFNPEEMAKTFGVMSSKDIYVVRSALIVVIFWAATWNLLEEFVKQIEMRYECARWKIYTTMLLLVMLFIILDPNTFEKL
jgi:hypothetical protein